MTKIKKEYRIVHQDDGLDTRTLMLEGVDTSRGPRFRIGTVAKAFFNRSPKWLRQRELELSDALPRRARSGERIYDLASIEKFAHELYGQHIIGYPEFRNALMVVRSIAIVTDYLEPNYE